MTYVLGMGNILLKDDGFGVRVVEELQKLHLPAGVLVIDIGTSILRMLTELYKASKIIIVDAIRAGGEPGTIYKITDTVAKKNISRSVHDVQFDELMYQLSLLGVHFEIEYIGIEPQEINFGLNLSETVKSKVPIVVDYLYKKIYDDLSICSA